MKKIQVVAVIPARMDSNRYPGKPLLNIEGLPMIEHVRRRVLLCDKFTDVVVATCDTVIKDVVEMYGGTVLMTNEFKHLFELHRERTRVWGRDSVDSLPPVIQHAFENSLFLQGILVSQCSQTTVNEFIQISTLMYTKIRKILQETLDADFQLDPGFVLQFLEPPEQYLMNMIAELL